MAIVVPEDAVQILTDQLEEVLKSVTSKPKEERYERLPKAVVELVDLSKSFAKEKNLPAAIATLNKAVKEFPKYTRGRLQLVMWQKRQGNSSIALFSAGHAFGMASEVDTKCQLLSLAGDTAMALYKKTEDAVEARNAITFYRMAMREDASNPHPAWNIVEAQVVIDGLDSPHTIVCVENFFEAVDAGHQNHKPKLKMILNDWEKVLGENFPDYRNKLQYYVDLAPVTKDDEQKFDVRRLTKRTLVAASVAASLLAIENGEALLDAGQSAVEIIFDSVSSQNQDSAVPEGQTAPITEVIEVREGSSDAETFRAGVEFLDEELTHALMMGVEFDDGELT